MDYVKITSQIKKWDNQRTLLDDMIDLAYEQLDNGTDHSSKLLEKIKKWMHERDKLDDLIDGAYLEVDKHLYNQAM